MKKLKTVLLVGRPNVGKSTLFNRLAKKRQALVEDRPGITRDLIETKLELSSQTIRLIDSGGLQSNALNEIEKMADRMTQRGIEVADLLLFVVDAKTGLLPEDENWARKLRKLGKPILLVFNKVDLPTQHFSGEKTLGFQTVEISAEHNRNIQSLIEQIENHLPATKLQSLPDFDDSQPKNFSVVIMGRPNVGKSSLFNAILGDERVLVHDAPGTTRDPIDTLLTIENESYQFIDTAGIRKRAKTIELVEKISVIKSLDTLESADLVLLVLDTTEFTAQDAHVAGLAFELGKAMILVCNKWDLQKENPDAREKFELQLERMATYLKFCPRVYVSAKTGKGLSQIFTQLLKVKQQYRHEVKTSELNRVFKKIVDHHPLPVYKGKNIKMYYATQVRHSPPTFAVFSNQPEHVHFSYKRYIINALKETFALNDVPVRIVFKPRT